MEKTDLVMDRLREELRIIPQIKHFFSISGAGGTNKAIAFVTLVPKDQRDLTQKDLQAVLRKVVAGLPDVRGSVSDVSPMGGQSRNEDVQLVIQGPDIDGIDRYSKEVMDRLSTMPGYTGVTRDLEIGKPEVRVNIDREKAADAGVSVRSIGAAVGALMGGTDVATYKEGGKRYDIRVRLIQDQRLLPQDIEKIWIRTATGELVDISNFTKIEIGVGPSVISRRDRQRSATVYANLVGKLMGDALPEVRQIAAEILPDGYSFSFMGRGESFVETGQYILFAFMLAILLTYMVLAAQFESFIQPFSIMMGLPLSFIGAFGMLFLFQNTFNLYSMIGLVLLVGLVTKNGILLIDYANQRRGEGMPIHEALVIAGATRLRPILMTSASTVAGVVPVALGIGVGSESRQPMAVVIAGGILSSTVLTLVVIPVIYSYLDQFSQWRVFDKIKMRLMAKDARRVRT
jgi:HAE1 family hydrophobic/amphiphilic exporter-1